MDTSSINTDRLIERLAAEVRQLFRAHRAGDAKAVEVALFHFEHYLTLTVRRLLRLQAESGPVPEDL